MVVPSKLFVPPFNRVHCGYLHSLPGQSCTEAFIWNLYRNHVSSAKYYLPVLLLPLILNWRRQTKRRLRSTVKHYLQTTIFASLINALTIYFTCIFRRINGRFVWLCTPGLSCFLAAQVTWWAPPKVQQFYVTGISYSAMEGLLRQVNVGLVHSRPAQTLVFMLCSLVVLQRQQTSGYSGFWFIRPAQMSREYNQWTLAKRVKQALLELRTYLGIGLGLDLFNAIQRRNIRKLRFKSAGFLLGYMGIYKVIQCLLVSSLQLKHTNLLAAFLSGASFGLSDGMPLSFMCLAVVIASQVLWQQLCTLDATRSGFLAMVQGIPWAKLLIPPNLAYLVHSMFYQRYVVNTLAQSFIDSTCDKNALRIYSLLKLPLDILIATVQQLPITSFLF